MSAGARLLSLRGVRCGFTLLELLIVLVLLGLMAGLTTVSLRSDSGLERTGEALITRLLDARVIALRSGRSATLVVEAEDGVLRTWVEASGERVRERERAFPVGDVIDETPDFGWVGAGGVLYEAASDGGVRAVYSGSGRADVRRWVLRAGGGASAKMVVIEFDPVTGVPRLHPGG